MEIKSRQKTMKKKIRCQQGISLKQPTVIYENGN
jgi:hypothetical protein